MASTATGTETMPTQQPRTVIITIRVDPQGKILSVEPDEFKISKKGNEQVMWVTDPANPPTYFTVEFDEQEGSPFYESQFNSEFNVSGPVRRVILADRKKYYKYAVRTDNDEKDPGGYVQL
jgi:hypothetical protein